MKTLTNEQANSLLLVAGNDWLIAIKDAYLLGQIHGIDPLRFEAAKAALTGYRSRIIEATPVAVAYLCVKDADALIAELQKPKKDAH